MNKEYTVISDHSTESGLVATPIDSISTTVQEMRTNFANGIMRDMEFRKQQLKALLRGLHEHEQFLLHAAIVDFGRSPLDSEFFDLAPVEFAIGQALA
ncbi:hypothetical protein FBU59_005531, partial [Linderina macrospora]